MQQKQNIKVALIGNPNTGKTSVFNQLTGLNQQVGNYPGITVEKKQGICNLSAGFKAEILDLPGNLVEILQIAPFGDPLFLNVNDSFLAIRLETACKIQVEICSE